MNWNTAFDRTLKEFGISAKWLSERCGLSQQSISKFRNGHCPMTTDNLNALLSELPFDARERFFSLLLGSELPPAQLPPIEAQIESLPAESKKKLVVCIFDSLASSPARVAS